MQSQCKVDVYHAGQQAGIPCAFFASVADVVDSPQMQARGFFTEIEHPEAGPLRYPGLPFRVGEQVATLTAAPLLGQHNREVFGDRFGLGPEQLERLRQDGVI